MKGRGTVTYTTRGTNGTRGTHGTRGTRATDVTREGPRLNKNRLKADLHTWLAEYKGREMKERRKDLQASIMKENRAKVVQIEEQKRQLRSNFFSNFRDSSDTPSIRAFGNDGEVVKEAVRKQTSKCWRILFKLHESLEVPTSTSWVMSKKNILTEHVTELELCHTLGKMEYFLNFTLSITKIRATCPRWRSARLSSFSSIEQ